MELRLTVREREVLARGSRGEAWVLAVWDELSRGEPATAKRSGTGGPGVARNLSETFARVVARERGSALERASAARAVRALVRHQPRLRHATDSDDPAVWLGALLALTAGDSGASDPRGAARWRARDALLGSPAVAPGPGGAGVDLAPAVRLAALASLPPWLAEAALRGRPPGADAPLIRHLCSEPPLTLRANRLRGTREEAVAALQSGGDAATERAPLPGRGGPGAAAPRFNLAATALSAEGLTVQGVLDVTSTRAFRHGWVEFQDEASQLVAELVAPPERGLVVDACAGAGGKTLALGARMGNRGRLVALDPAEHRLAELARRAKRAGLHTVERRRWALGVPVTASSGADALADLVGRADRVLVDAPCTGVGALRRKPELLWHLDPAAPGRLAAEQGALMEAASALVKPGGRLIYATCTVLLEECEGVVQAFLARHPEFAAVPIREVLGRERARAVESADGMALASWTAPAEDPRAAGLDGFFAAVLRRARR